MHNDFADWYQSTNIDNDSKKLGLRWKGVKQVSDNLDNNSIPTLVKIAFGRNDNYQAESGFKEVFKEHDPGFLMKDNEHEIRVLAASVLAFEMTADGNDAGLVATSILTTHLYDERKLEVKFDLIGIAKSAIVKCSQSERVRPTYKEIVFPKITKQNILDKIAEISQEQNWNKVQEVMEAMTEQILGHSKQTRTTIQDHIRPVWDYITVQDEELEMVWWLVNKWCQLVEKPFDKVPAEMRSLLFGKEIADMTHVNIEPPALMGMLATTGVSESKLTIPEAVNACGTKNLSKFQYYSNACTTLTPVHSAIGRAIETDCGESWIPAWQKVCGISKVNKIPSIELAMQVHREQIVLMSLADDREND